MATNWQDSAHRELLKSRKAAEDKLAGRSRVAARRAAGIALAEYNRLEQFTRETDNYYDLLQSLLKHPGVPQNIQQATQRLCQRVDEQYNLPDDFHLINDAEILVKFVESQTAEIMKNGD
jgi:hypothetical protein